MARKAGRRRHQPGTAVTASAIPSAVNGTTRNDNPLNPFRYSAKRYDTGSQTLDTGARRFDLGSGRFIQPDLFRGALDDLGLATDPLNQNRYALAAANPVGYAESDGHMLVDSGGGGASTATTSSTTSTSGTQQSALALIKPGTGMLIGHLGIEPTGPTAGLYREMTAHYIGGWKSLLAGALYPAAQALDLCTACRISLKAATGQSSFSNAYLGLLHSHGVPTGSNSYFGAGYGTSLALTTFATAGIGAPETSALGTETGVSTAAEDVPQVIFRTGSRTDNALTDPSGVSFRSSVSSSTSTEFPQRFKVGDKIWAVNTDQLPDGSVVVDNNPPGHVSVFATPADINAAVVPHGPENFLEQLGLKILEEFGSYRLPK